MGFLMIRTGRAGCRRIDDSFAQYPLRGQRTAAVQSRIAGCVRLRLEADRPLSLTALVLDVGPKTSGAVRQRLFPRDAHIRMPVGPRAKVLPDAKTPNRKPPLHWIPAESLRSSAAGRHERS